MERKPLSPRQQAVLDFVRSSVRERALAPTLREIGTALGIRSTNGVKDHLDALEGKGWIRRGPTKSRAILVVGETHAEVEAERDRLRLLVTRLRRRLPALVTSVEAELDNTTEQR